MNKIQIADMALRLGMDYVQLSNYGLRITAKNDKYFKKLNKIKSV
jgi:hypothetical protein